LFPCQYSNADEVMVNCVVDEDVKAEFWDTLGAQDSQQSTDPCKKLIEDD